MPDGPESIGEIARLLRTHQTHTDRQFETLNTRLDKLVSVEVHQLYITSMERRISEIMTALSEETQSRKLADQAETAKREKAIEDERSERKAAQEKAGLWTRWLAAAVLVPIVMWAATLVSSGGGT